MFAIERDEIRSLLKKITRFYPPGQDHHLFTCYPERFLGVKEVQEEFQKGDTPGGEEYTFDFLTEEDFSQRFRLSDCFYPGCFEVAMKIGAKKVTWSKNSSLVDEFINVSIAG
jgi:hypothetical protein